ncbi:MAG: large subunit ribosomal protein [Pyrinomonadaceae bacterium]|nr:large subunit ribosomal protein [Pyrinomonadaceae bacterium]
MDARASAKYLRGSPQKARLVVDMIRGKNVNEALAVLQYTNKRAADGIEKCVRSAVANATEAAEKANIAVDPDDLWVKAAFIDMGPTKNRRRMRPAPQGRAYKERRHFHHVTVLLSSDEQEAVKGKPSKAGKPRTTKPGKKLAAKSAASKPATTKRAATKQPETAASETPAATTTPATETATEE